MTKRTARKRFIRAAMAMAVGGSAFQLSGCDPAVRQTLLDGLQSSTQALTGSLIDAFFVGLQDNAGGGGLTTTG